MSSRKEKEWRCVGLWVKVHRKWWKHREIDDNELNATREPTWSGNLIRLAAVSLQSTAFSILNADIRVNNLSTFWRTGSQIENIIIVNEHWIA
jgi:hypothetical protein